MKKIGNFLASLVSIIYFFALLVMLLLIFASNIFSANYYKQILDDNDLSEIKLSDLGVESYSEEFGEDASVEDILVQSLEEAGISMDDAIEIVNSEEVNKVVGTFISDTVDYLVTKEEIPQLNYQDVKNVLENDKISSVLDDIPSDEELKQIVDELNKVIVESFEEEFNYVE